MTMLMGRERRAPIRRHVHFSCQWTLEEKILELNGGIYMSEEKKSWEGISPKVGPVPDDFEREFIGKVNEVREKFSQTDFEDLKGVLKDVVEAMPDQEDKKTE